MCIRDSPNPNPFHQQQLKYPIISAAISLQILVVIWEAQTAGLPNLYCVVRIFLWLVGVFFA